MAGNKPEFSVKVGAIQLAVWTNEGGRGDGRTFETQSISITRTYKKGDKFETTNSMRFTDLPLMKLAIDEAMKYKYLKSLVVTEDDSVEKEF